MTCPETTASERQLEEWKKAFCFEKGKFRIVVSVVFKSVKCIVLIRVAEMGRTKVLLTGRQMMVQLIKKLITD